MGVLSVPLLPSLSLPSSSRRACRTTHNTNTHLHATCTFTFSFHGSHSRAASARTRFISVRADASLPELAPTAAAVYGSFLLGGGLYAYAKNSSTGSLLAGVTGGIIMGLVFLLSLKPDAKDLGEAIGFGTALLFAALFGIRLAATKKVFPSAPLMLLSMVASAVFVGAYLQDRV